MGQDELSIITGVPPKPIRFGRFLLQELINSGGMADIWVATDEDGKTFALRRLKDNSTFNFTAKKRFNQGAEILAKIQNHEFIIGYYEHGKIEGALYMLMEYLEGSNLKLLLSRGDEVLTENIGNVLIDMGVALEHVHESGYMHLDFKPENILLSRNASLRLIDFDLAMPKPAKPEKTSKNPGTPGYMAPEQLQRQPFDHRVDIFAFGVTAYELLTGEKPFPGETAEAILRSQLSATLVPPREINSDVPIGMEKIILKCLSIDPELRYPYMSVLVRDLQIVLYV
ncbi:MAG: Serine/threonine-protein kinase StkP [Verrucomicrobiales bacterium]|jgi:serine/threonine protein kinase|nr:Serine/threonine-protein kinase StkP [Verrucomicrobiales bacterium]MDB6130147.1 Serine/threonine-protein kinase StkP [Verrucomicrobiales bacterium]